MTRKLRRQISEEIEPLCLLLDVTMYFTNEGDIVMFRTGYYLDTHIEAKPRSADEVRRLLATHFT